MHRDQHREAQPGNPDRVTGIHHRRLVQHSTVLTDQLMNNNAGVLADNLRRRAHHHVRQTPEPVPAVRALQDRDADQQTEDEKQPRQPSWRDDPSA